MPNKFWDSDNGVTTNARNRGCSNLIWGSCPEDALRLQMLGTFMVDDFITYQADLSGWDILVNSTGSVAGADLATGGLALTTAGTANDYAYAIYGNGKTGMGQIADGTRMWFEARIKVSAITACSINAGLALVGANTFQAAGAIVDTTGASATSNGSYLLFRTLAASPSSMDVVYATDGTAATVLQQGSTGLFRADGTTRLQTLVADTFVKVGFLYEKGLVWAFVDGKLVNETGVRYNATNVPDGVSLAPFFGIKTLGSAARTLTVDWVKAAYQDAA